MFIRQRPGRDGAARFQLVHARRDGEGRPRQTVVALGTVPDVISALDRYSNLMRAWTALSLSRDLDTAKEMRLPRLRVQVELLRRAVAEGVAV